MLAGGAAGKAGDRYEDLWTVRQLIRVVQGKTRSIRIEVPDEDKSEFVITCKDGRSEFHQAKRQAPNENWKVSQLDSKGILPYFGKKLQSGQKCVFFSTSDVKHLRELCLRARNASSVSEFKGEFLKAKWARTTIERIQRSWKNCSLEDAFERLQRLEIRTQDAETLREDLVDKCGVVFTGNAQASFAQLKDICTESVHQLLTRSDILKALKKAGFELRHIKDTDGLDNKIGAITESYLEPIKNRHIAGQQIDRQEAKSIVERIKESATSVDLLVSGEAGVGKSNVLFQAIEKFQLYQIPVLALRLDNINPAATTIKLGQEYELPESPAFSLTRAFPNKEVVIVIDQLDAVSTTSGRRSDFFGTVENVVREIRGLRHAQKVHLILSCREFDLSNDHRIKKLATESTERHKIDRLGLSEVSKILTKCGFDTGHFAENQLSILQLPQNLSLFLSAVPDPKAKCVFKNQKDLFDDYWDHKQKQANIRYSNSNGLWVNSIETITDHLSSYQQLWASIEVLDNIPRDYIEALASEGVIIIEENKVRFGHESFFDYCFARTFVRKSQSLLEFLTNDEQHLFRRAQVRQVLAYMADSNFETYIDSVSELLASNEVRFHIKHLIIALLTLNPDIHKSEWAILLPYIKSEIGSRDKQDEPLKTDHSKVQGMVWKQFFGNSTLFPLIDKSGELEKWLDSDAEAIVNSAIFYMRVHTDQHGDRIAEILEKYENKGGAWKDRLRYMFEGHTHDKSRRLFDLFLRLLETGILDDARDRFATNGTFWSMLYGLGDSQPEWGSELAACWIRRQIAIHDHNSEKIRKRDLFQDEFGANVVLSSSRNAPEQFLFHVLPAFFEVANLAAYPEKNEQLISDSIWALRYKDNEYIGLGDAFLHGLRNALAHLISHNDPAASEYIKSLIQSRLDTANWILLSALTEGNCDYADLSIKLLTDDPLRIRCGYGDSAHWVTRELIEQASPHCSGNLLNDLVQHLLDYYSPYEKTVEGLKARGSSQLTLLKGIQKSRRSEKVQQRINELERKFGTNESSPKGITSYFVTSPIDHDRTEILTDPQWLSAIKKYDTEDRLFDSEHPEKGGARELSRELESCTKDDPIRFGNLSLHFSSKTHPCYYGAVLRGLIQGKAPTSLKLKVSSLTSELKDSPCGRDLADLYASITDQILPDEAIEQLIQLATEHPDPERESWEPNEEDSTVYYGGCILTAGINTVRGHGVEAMRTLLFSSSVYAEKFATSFEKMVQDPSLAVRSCAASTLSALSTHDADLAVTYFLQLVETRDELLATSYVDKFIIYCLRDHFSLLTPLLSRMLYSPLPKVQKTGARLTAIGALTQNNNIPGIFTAFHKCRMAISICAKKWLRKRSWLNDHSLLSGNELIYIASKTSVETRLGLAQVASKNISNPEIEQWCRSMLIQLFYDEEESILTETGQCFRDLWDKDPSDYIDIIEHFSKSPAFAHNLFAILHWLETTTYQIPSLTIEICRNFLEKFSDDAANIQTDKAGRSRTVSKLIYMTYAQHDDPNIQKSCLDLIDKMCCEEVYGATRGIEEFER